MNTLDWTLDNAVTVTLMVLLVFFGVATGFRVVKSARARAAA